MIKIFKKFGRILRRAAGFTILEMLIAMSVFIVFITLSSSAYIGLMKANRLASDTQRIYRDVRHIFDSIAEEAHNNQIDFTCFDRQQQDLSGACLDNSINTAPNIIAFIAQTPTGAERTLYKFENGSIKVLKQKRDASDLSWEGSEWIPLIADATTFEEVSFSVFPLKNPYDSENVSEDGIQWQPSIRLTVKRGEIVYHTTYSSRSYGTASLYKSAPLSKTNIFNPANLELRDINLNGIQL